MKLSKSSSTYLFMAIVIATVVTLHLIAGKLILTGDEPRYLFASVSAWSEGNFLMSQAHYSAWLGAHNLDINYEASRGVHSVIHSLLLSPIATNFGLEATRWTQLLIVSSVAALYWKYAPPESRLGFGIWTLLYFASVPVLPYLKLIYSEAWVFFLFSIVVIFSSIENKTTVQRYVLLIAIVTLPFIHLRTVLAAFIFGLYFVHNEWNSNPKDVKNIRIMSLIVVLSLLLFGLYQLALSGSLTGTAHPTYSPTIESLLDRIAAQFFGYRHGLYFNSPMALIGLAGLILGAFKRNGFFSICLLSLSVYVVTFSWNSASESYAARFWVFAIPLFIYGSYYWLNGVESKFKWVIVTVLIGLTIFNTALFASNQNYYLENRFGSIGYEFFYDHFSHFFNLNLISAADSYDGGLTILNPQNNFNVLALLTLFVLGLVGMGFKLRRNTNISIAVVIFVFSISIYQSYMTPIDKDQYVVSHGIDGLGRSFINFTFQKSVVVHGLRFGKYLDRPSWGSEEATPKQFVINGRDAAGVPIAEQRIPGSQLVKFSRSEKLTELSVISYSPEFIKKLDISSLSLF